MHASRGKMLRADETKPRPCPFCGSVNIKIKYHMNMETKERVVAAYCVDCQAHGPLDAGKINDAMFNICTQAWNARTEEK